MGSGDAHMCPTDAPLPGGRWVSPGVKRRRGDASQRSTAVNVSTRKVEQLLPVPISVSDCESTDEHLGLCHSTKIKPGIKQDVHFTALYRNRR